MTIADGVRAFGQALPNRLCISDSKRNLTFRDFDRRSSALANGLLGHGISPGERIGVLMGNRAEFLEAIAAIGKAGLQIVPLSPRGTFRETGYMAEHSSISALIFDQPHEELALRLAEHLELKVTLGVDTAVGGIGYEDLLADASDRDPMIPVDETDPFIVAYTSGTTGNPKGVLLSHRARSLLFYCVALEYGLGPTGSTIGLAPMYHGAGFAFAYASLHSGGAVRIMERFDPERLLHEVAAFRPTTLFVVPTHVRALRDLGEDTLARADFSSLRCLYTGAAAFPDELKAWLLDSLPDVPVHDHYGSTEIGIVTNLRPEDQRRKTRCVGPVWYMNELQLLGDDGMPVPVGEPGEIFSRSPFLMNGYLDNEEATRECMTEDGFMSAGDVGVLDEGGYLYVVDRKKDMIVTGGLNVYSREVEEVLLEHDDINDVAVIGSPSDKWGEEVTAFVTLRPGREWNAEAVTGHCRELLAGYKVPKQLILKDDLPRSASGKVRKGELRAELEAEGP